ncbi:hypothetical protein BCF44_106487 [Kutzneria buriramensis]|uniref:Uncharacterized protein n=1 Tax=Kutzneria buriramensis TaxID=1045776 RepID=A0A3E0HLG1_9PSEU|nr:hypothetical protein BCF44_106487 [Kutzneria buriramensis]
MTHGGTGVDAESVGEDLRRGLTSELLPGRIAHGSHWNSSGAQDIPDLSRAAMLSREKTGKQPRRRRMGSRASIETRGEVSAEQRSEGVANVNPMSTQLNADARAGILDPVDA